VSKIKDLGNEDPFRVDMTEKLLDKLYNMGFIPTKKNLTQCEKLAASAICRRRLPVVMVRLKMAESMREAVSFVEQAHVRVGTEVITDPAFLVTRSMEDYVTWVDTSKIKRTVAKYNDKLDDFDLLGC
jgi:U3 small nucleolar ribonucleoprotein protein IMP3